jgi:hypothetical protein
MELELMLILAVIALMAVAFGGHIYGRGAANGDGRGSKVKRITGCRVTVIAPSHKHRHGTGFQVHIWLTIPSYENIVVNNSASDDARHEHAEVAIKDAFAAARRQVDDLAA